MRLILLAVLTVPLFGCHQSPPTLAGGKPVSHWVETLRSDPDAKSRKEAAFKLGNVGPTDPTAFPALMESLKDRDATVRNEAILAILKFGPTALEAVPTLTELRDRDRDPKVRDSAAKALKKLQQKE